MKALALTLALIVSIFTANASDAGINKKGKRAKSKTEQLKAAVTSQVNKHIFYPVQGESKNIEGQADVMFQVMPAGDVQVVLIQTKNPLMKKFIENQAKKMKVGKDEYVAGEIFKYRFVFKAKS